jgi:hypothetical protein
MAVLRKRIDYAIERQRVREAEADKETAARRVRLIREHPELQDAAAGPPDEKSKWTWGKHTDPYTGEMAEGWTPDDMIPAGHPSIFCADTPEERLPCRYLEIAMIHDLTDSDLQRARPKLLEGLDLPEEIAGQNAWSMHSISGLYCPGALGTSEGRRHEIDRALADVKADLAIEQGEQAGGSGASSAQARKAVPADPPTAGEQIESPKRLAASERRSSVDVINTDQGQKPRREKLGRRQRRSLSPEDEAKVLEKCRRRCCVCFVLDGDASEKKGQLAHLDQNRSNNTMDNFVYLCFHHHDTYDSKTSQSKNLTEGEVRLYQAKLHQAVEQGEVPRRP